MSTFHAYTSCRYATRDKKMMATPFFIFILIPLVIGGVIAWQKGGKGGKWVLILPGIFLAFLFVHYFFAFRSSPERLYEATYVSQRSELPGWYEKLSQESEADVYPSLETAARSLGRKIAPKVASLVTKQESVLEAYITQTELTPSETATMERESLDCIRHEIHNILQLPSLTIKVDTGTEGKRSRHPSESLVLQVKIANWTRNSAAWSRKRYQIEGTLQVSARHENEEFKELVQFSEKPWVEDFETFRAEEARPGNQTWLFGKSQTPGHRASYAQREAIEDGIRQLQPLVESRLQKYLRRQGWFGSSRPNSREVQEILRQELRRQVYVTDRLVQRFQQHGTTIWWEGMLINASEQNLERLAERCVQGEGRQEWTWARTAWSASGLLGLVCGIYLFINLATRGYYVWALRGAIILVLIVILIMVGLSG